MTPEPEIRGFDRHHRPYQLYYQKNLNAIYESHLRITRFQGFKSHSVCWSFITKHREAIMHLTTTNTFGTSMAMPFSDSRSSAKGWHIPVGHVTENLPYSSRIYQKVASNLANSMQLYLEEDYVRGSLNKFPDFFRMGTSIDSTHMKH